MMQEFTIGHVSNHSIARAGGRAESLRAFVEAHVRSGDSLGSCDLQGAKLAGVYLPDAMISSSNLVNAVLRGAYMPGADFERASLDAADLSGAYLAGANFKGANLRGAKLAYAYVAAADFEGANLEGCDLTGCDLDRALNVPASAVASPASTVKRAAAGR